jgi:hypothetical protein
MDKTLMILGAGASKDFCRAFPTGIELIKEVNYHFNTEKKVPSVPLEEGEYLSALMNEICRTIGNDTLLFSKIKNQLWSIQLHYEHRYLRNRINDPLSIDNFIAENFKNGHLDRRAISIIKYAIYYLIKGAEQALSEGAYDLSTSWIKLLAGKLMSFDFKEILENFKVIIFNYDRVFEKYFPEFLKLDVNHANTFANGVLHIYDYLGNLNEVPFGMANDRFEVFKDKFERIKLIEDRSNIPLVLSNADKYKNVHFIGFGYDEVNLKLLNLSQFTSANFLGTAYGMDLCEVEELKRKFLIDAKIVSCKEYVSQLKF